MQIDKIFHISDVHIRNYRRHTEYNNVFKKLYKLIKEKRTPNSVIFLGGDIVHQKTDLSPELVAMTGDFLKSCASLCNTILITGNHDTNLNNSSRLDALTPIIDNLKVRKLHYWKDSGVYKINPDDNVSWAVFSVFDSPQNWPKASSIKNNDIKIALHHGSVNGAITDMDYDITNDTVTVKNFKGYDYALLGDIHKFQYLNKEETIAYSSSLIQQSYGESIDNHGLIIWNLVDKTKEFIHIENDIAYCNIHFQDNKLITPPEYFQKIPKYLRVKIKHENTDRDIIDQFIEKLKKKHVFKEFSYKKISTRGIVSDNDLVIGNIRDVEFQNKLITEYLIKNNPNISEALLDSVRFINRKVNSEATITEKQIKNTIWRLISMEFNDMFSYGSGNKIDFTKLNGIQGVFGPNATGKSSLLEILLFGLFDKSSKTYKTDEILNVNSDNFFVRVVLEINGEEYIIERRATANEHRRVRVDVDFYKNDGSTNSLKGKDRDDTNKIIRSYIGTYDDFMLTALSTQTDNRNFVFKSQRERKELLYSFLDLKIFTELFVHAKNILKEKQAILSQYQEKVVVTRETELLTKRKELEDKLLKLTDDIEYWKTRHSNAIVSQRELLLKINEVEISDNLDEITTRHSNLLNEIEQIKKTAKEVKSERDAVIAKLQKTRLETIDEERENNLKHSKKSIETKLIQIEQKLNSEKKSLEHLNEQKSLLAAHEYDPNCKFCVNNQLVKTATNAIELIPSVEQKIEKLNKLKTEYELNLNQIESVLSEIKLIHLSNKQHNELLSKSEVLNNKLHLLSEKFKTVKINYKHVETELAIYRKNEDTIKANILLKEELKKIEADLNHSKTQFEEKNENRVKISSTLARIDSELETIMTLKSEVDSMEFDVNSYNLYCNAVSPIGVSYSILAKILPLIENETNQILADVVDFQVNFSYDEKNIYCFIQYPSNGKIWPVELSSGMERFIVSIASRIALIEITSLARPNFIAIDEGFGVLDADNVSNVYKLFDKIRDKFDFMLCITHLDSLRDATDKQLIIDKIDGRSYINNG